jgi:diaminohydroxyphosphoribosylaminopyrimidine deaminase/5-amino-6-(5-phosphoribosylamino)uracil reductase
LGNTAPNPMVGCVIVFNDKIIGEGYTSPFGGAHAEVNAINSVINKEDLKNSTLYVSLEPCSHYGKTPPCCDLIINYKIPKVVIGCLDPNEKVNGKGIAKLKASGCEVITELESELCNRHHKRFLTFFKKKRPYIILKWAQTKNGFVAPTTKIKKSPVYITNKSSRQIVHKWRSEEQAILVGFNTINKDNPKLTTRMVKGSNPIRIVVCDDRKIVKKFNVFNDEAETIIINLDSCNKNISKAKKICDELFENNIISVIVEGGPKTLNYFIGENLWDEARIFIGEKEFNNGIKAPEIELNNSLFRMVDNDKLYIIENEYNQ